MNKEERWLLKEKYNGKPDKNFRNDLNRLKRGEPLDYVIGFKYFLGCKIDLSKKPLIPRQETEFWVLPAIQEIKNECLRRESASYAKFSRGDFRKTEKIKVLDIFAGSGCIGVAILANVPDILCDISEKDKKMVPQIKINLKNNFIRAPRCKVICSDIFKKVKGKYNFIFSNPPYIAKTRKNKIQKSVLKYEPKVALFGGKDGTFFINKFLNQAKKHLLAEGKIFMEFDSSQKNKIERLLKKNKYKSWQFNKDQYGRWRWAVVSGN